MGYPNPLRLILAIMVGCLALTSCTGSPSPDQLVHFSLGEEPQSDSSAIYVLYDYVQTESLDPGSHEIEVVETETQIQVFITVPPAIDGPLISQSLIPPDTEGPYGTRIDLRDPVGNREIVNGHLPGEAVNLHRWLLS